MAMQLETAMLPCWNEHFAKEVLGRSVECESKDRVHGETYQAWEGHLAKCDTCRQQLEIMAGSQAEWRLAKDLLSMEKSFESFPSASHRAELRRSHLMGYVEQHVCPHPSDDPQSLGRLGAYELVGIVGRGGMGIVFKAFDRALNRFVAIKILDPLIADREVARARFAREARSMASISHEHVVPIYSVDEHCSLPYFVMEYVPGGTLEHRLAAEGPMSTLPWLRVAIQIAQGLEAAHRQGLIHRDIKPSNILLDRGVERVRVTDFGLARELDRHGETCSDVLLGTPMYMSPEQVLGRPCDARSDLFSLGSLLYQLATGHPPFQGDSVYGTLRSIASEPPAAYEGSQPLPDWMRDLVLKLMAKDPEKRFGSAEELISALSDELVYFQDPTGKVPERRWRSTEAQPRAWKFPFAAGLNKLNSWALVAMAIAIFGIPWRSFLPFASHSPNGTVGPLSPATIDPNAPQEPIDPPEVGAWRDRIVAVTDHKIMAFQLGAELMKLSPELARQAVTEAWPKLKTRYAKTGLLKAFQFGEHPEVLAILHLGMTDADPEVRQYADHYLSRHSFRSSLLGKVEDYQQWYQANGTRPLDEVHEEGLKHLLAVVKKMECKTGLQCMAQYDLTWDQPKATNKSLAMIAKQLGYGELALAWMHEGNLEARERLAILRMMSALKIPVGPREERLLAKWERDEPAEFASAIFSYRSALDAEGVSQRLENRVKALLAEPTLDDAKSVVAMMMTVNDERAIPLQIAIIDADNSYDTVYGVGYFGLGQGVIGQKTKVRYSMWHDGPWWRRWWSKHREQFSSAAQAFPILDLPKTPHGESYRPLPFDIDTSEGRYALASHLMESQSQDWMAMADLVASSNDPRDIPLLIGMLDADNSNEGIYRLTYFGIVPLINQQGKHQVKYQAYRDGAWWKRWWSKHAADFGPECEHLTVPEFKKTPYGQTQEPFPEELDSPEGHRWIIQHELGQPTPQLVHLSQFFAEHGDERDLPWLIGIVVSHEGLEGVSFVKTMAIATIAKIQGVEGLAEKDANWWRLWWQENHTSYPTADPNLPDLQEWVRKPVNAELPLQTWTSKGATASYFRLGGDATAKVPPQGFKLLVVLPGGDGGRDFHPFVQSLYREALDSTWIVVQPLAIQWTPSQQIVWPTDVNPVEGMKFSTEEMVEGIIADVQSSYAIDANNVVSMAWSSSGPAAYALSLRPGGTIRGSYIAMSVFKPQFLVDLDLAKKHRFVIEHSPDDKLCPFRMAQLARTTLRQAGSEVTEVDYPGGHGWHGELFTRIRNALQTLTQEQ